MTQKSLIISWMQRCSRLILHTSCPRTGVRLLLLENDISKSQSRSSGCSGLMSHCSRTPLSPPGGPAPDHMCMWIHACMPTHNHLVTSYWCHPSHCQIQDYAFSLASLASSPSCLSPIPRILALKDTEDNKTFHGHSNALAHVKQKRSRLSPLSWIPAIHTGASACSSHFTFNPAPYYCTWEDGGGWPKYLGPSAHVKDGVLASAWPRPSDCGQLESDSKDRRVLCLSLFQ